MFTLPQPRSPGARLAPALGRLLRDHADDITVDEALARCTSRFGVRYLDHQLHLPYETPRVVQYAAAAVEAFATKVEGALDTEQAPKGLASTLERLTDQATRLAGATRQLADAASFCDPSLRIESPVLGRLAALRERLAALLGDEALDPGVRSAATRLLAAPALQTRAAVPHPIDDPRVARFVADVGVNVQDLGSKTLRERAGRIATVRGAAQGLVGPGDGEVAARWRQLGQDVAWASHGLRVAPGQTLADIGAAAARSYANLSAQTFVGAFVALSTVVAGQAIAGVVLPSTIAGIVVPPAVAATLLGAGALLAFRVGYEVADWVGAVAHVVLDAADSSHFKSRALRDVIDDFQAHHVDPMKIRADGYANLRRTVATTMPVVVATIAADPSLFTAFGLVGLFTGGLASMEMHRWSHTPTDETPRWVKALRTLRMGIDNAAHGRHHKIPRNNSYGILTGNFNPLWDALHLPKGIERLMASAGVLFPPDAAVPHWRVEQDERDRLREARKASGRGRTAASDSPEPPTA